MTHTPFRDALADQGKTITNLAYATGVSYTTAWRWVNTKTVPPPARRALIARTLGKTEASLWPDITRKEQAIGT